MIKSRLFQTSTINYYMFVISILFNFDILPYLNSLCIAFFSHYFISIFSFLCISRQKENSIIRELTILPMLSYSKLQLVVNNRWNAMKDKASIVSINLSNHRIGMLERISTSIERDTRFAMWDTSIRTKYKAGFN